MITREFIWKLSEYSQVENKKLVYNSDEETALTGGLYKAIVERRNGKEQAIPPSFIK